MLLKCEDCMVTFESESLKDCPSCSTADFIYQLSDNQVLAYEKNKLEKKLATATEALTRIKFNGLFKKAGPHGDYAPYNVATQTNIAEQALAEIGGKDGK